jgi:Uma2 family endonuclease
MAAVMQSTGTADHTVVLYNISWGTYDRLLQEQQENAGVRFSYYHGTLEIMILSLKHERLRHIFATLVELLASELEIDVEGAGSTTFRREDFARGFEPDASFYFSHAGLIRNRDEIDLTVDPAPELVIEIDITHSSLDKLPIFAGLGILEVWHYDDRTLTIHRLAGSIYQPVAESSLLPRLTDDQLLRFIHAAESLKRGQWIQLVRDECRR